MSPKLRKNRVRMPKAKTADQRASDVIARIELLEGRYGRTTKEQWRAAITSEIQAAQVVAVTEFLAKPTPKLTGIELFIDEAMRRLQASMRVVYEHGVSMGERLV